MMRIRKQKSKSQKIVTKKPSVPALLGSEISLRYKQRKRNSNQKRGKLGDTTEPVA